MESDSYNDMVFRLFKKTGVFKDDLMHAAVGVVGEVAELMEASTPKNRLEELGDILFYIEAGFQQLQVDRFQAIELPEDQNLQPINIHLFCIVVHAGKLVDATKKSWIYGRAPDLDTIARSLAVVYWEVACIAYHFGLELEDLEKANRAKLEERYPEKFYTDAHAIARLDKAAEEVQDVVVISDEGRRRSEGSMTFAQALGSFEPLPPVSPEEDADINKEK